MKAVVFLSFWQGQTLLFMVKMQWIKVSQRETKTDYDAAEVATAMQEFLICVEMFFAAIAALLRVSTQRILWYVYIWAIVFAL